MKKSYRDMAIDLEIELLAVNMKLDAYKSALKETNDWLLAGEGIDLCCHIDDDKTKAIVRVALDSIYNEPKPR